MENHQMSTQHSTNVQYVGVRQRKWGKWVSEIREQGTKTRIWLGSYEAPEMAAAAYDVAALKLRGSGARLNFPELMDSLPKPTSSNPEDIQVAAQEAATRFKRPLEISLDGLGSCDLRPVTVKLSPSQIQAINEFPLESPKMWMEPHLDYDHLREWDEMLLGSIWND